MDEGSQKNFLGVPKMAATGVNNDWRQRRLATLAVAFEIAQRYKATRMVARAVTQLMQPTTRNLTSQGPRLAVVREDHNTSGGGGGVGGII